MGSFPQVRLRRLRQHPALRSLVNDVQLSVTDLVLPLFIHHGQGVRQAISSMPGCYQLSVDELTREIADIVELKIPAVILFGLPDHKDAIGSRANASDGVVQRAIRAIKQQAPDLLVIVDLCFCEYTDHGHCGVVSKSSKEVVIDNDATLELLAAQAVSLAQAGADVIAPSGMIDGMVQAIRQGLDHANFSAIPVLSYSVKYASGLYGPFREAADGAPQFGDRSSYQMDPCNRYEALREVEQDLLEGADVIMVKPALAYLDVITRIKTTYPHVPLAAYQVSGEFAMIKAAAEKGWIDERRVALESLYAIKRAGADFIITYYAKQAAAWLTS